MNFSELISKKKEQIKECNIQIRTLQKSYKNEIYQQDKDKLIAFIRQKKELLKSLNAEEDPKEFTKKLDTLDEKIHRQYLILRQSILDNQDSTKKLDEILNDFNLDELYNLKKIFLFLKNHPLISIFSIYILGCVFFIYYFYIDLRYIPYMDIENFFYYLVSFMLFALFFIFSIGVAILIKINFFSYIKKQLNLDYKLILVIILFLLFLAYEFKIELKYFNDFFFNYLIILTIFYIFIIILQQIIIKKFNIIKTISNNINTIIIHSLAIVIFLKAGKHLQAYLDQENDRISLIPLIFFIFLGFITKIRFSFILFLSIFGSLIITIPYSIPLAIKFARFGNYTPKTLIVDSKAYIPKESFDSTKDSENLIIKNPTILSNVGEDYLVELKDKNGKPHRFTIPKNLVKSQEISISNQDKKQSDKKRLNPSFISPYSYVKPI